MFVFVSGLSPLQVHADASTQFNVYVPPNNIQGRDVLLIVTAVSAYDTTVSVVDDGADGDTDDTYLNRSLQRGQSQLVWLRDGGVNDDAGGKWDGDYFLVTANHPVVVQMATQSNWQHDWVPSDGKSGLGMVKAD